MSGRCCLFFFLAVVWVGRAISDPRISDGPAQEFVSSPESRLTVCSQNLANYGLPEEVSLRTSGHKGLPLHERESRLVARFRDAECSIVAVQEVVGSSRRQADRGLKQLADALGVATGRQFTSVVGGASPGDVRLGLLVAKDIAPLERVVSYDGTLLPRIYPTQRLERLSRGPLVAQVRWHHQRITLVNVHFKSKYGGGRDPSRLQFEPLRMQMAQQVRSLVEGHFLPELLSADEWVIVMGDRNSRQGSASDSILRGERSLSDFDGPQGCIVARWGETVCPHELPGRTPLLVSALKGHLLEGKPLGTYRYRSTYEWIDDILVSRWSLLQAMRRGEVPRSRVVWEPPEASDHAMVVLNLVQGCRGSCPASLMGESRRSRGQS